MILRKTPLKVYSNLKHFPSTLFEFILECYTPLLLYTSTHTRFFCCNPCLLYLMLYCELYSSTLLHYSFSMHLHLYACMMLVLYCELNACTVLRHSFPTSLLPYASTPLHLYASTPLCLYASTPLHVYTSPPLRLYT